MILYPAIDLKKGKCVRLKKGDFQNVTIFNEDPVDQAQTFEIAGCEWIHLVDLEGAFEGKNQNSKVIKNILKKIETPIQLGGGIRDLKTINFWISNGIKRIILGTAAINNPKLLKSASISFPGKIAVGLDARNGYLASDGWKITTNVKASELAKRYEDIGVCAIIYTDINRDGAMSGPNIEETVALANSVSIPVIASGGVSSIDDLKSLKACEANLDGVICGRALYEGKLDLIKALQFLKET